VNALIERLLAEPDRVVLLAGSGMSRSAAIPTGGDLIGLLAARLGVRAVPSPIGWYVATFGRWPSYEALLYEAYEVNRGTDPGIFFTPTAEDVQAGRRIPQSAHRALADLVRAGYFRLILTTNFDRLIETALADAGMTARVASLPPDMALPRSDDPAVLKLHGDYADLVPKVLPRRQCGYAAAEIRAVLAGIFAKHHVLVCGWSAAWDTALAEALATAPPWRSVYWLTIGGLSPAAQSVADQRNAMVTTIDGADAFFIELAGRLLPVASS
jgi:hypothetical protein